MPFSAFPKSAYAVTASSPCVDGMSVSHTGAELLSASGIRPDKDCLLSGECAPSTTASLLLKRHLCRSSHPFLHPEPSHALKDLIMALLHLHALHMWPFQGLHVQNMPLLHAKTRVLHCYLAYLLQTLLLHVSCVSGRCLAPARPLAVPSWTWHPVLPECDLHVLLGQAGQSFQLCFVKVCICTLCCQHSRCCSTCKSSYDVTRDETCSSAES